MELVAKSTSRVLSRIGRKALSALAGACVAICAIPGPAGAQQLDQAAVIRGVDAAVRYRVDRITAYTVTEKYAVYRGSEGTPPVAGMTVRTTYRRGVGKNYDIQSQSGSAIIRHLGLEPVLEREKEINEPGNVEHAWITSANYDMTLKPGTQRVNGHECYELAIHPKEKAPNLIDGSIWVDTKDFTILRLQGVASKSPSIFAGTTHMQRDYADIDGFSMATHARAESSTFIYGTTIVTIDYTGYNIQQVSAGGAAGDGQAGARHSQGFRQP